MLSVQQQWSVFSPNYLQHHHADAAQLPEQEQEQQHDIDSAVHSGEEDYLVVRLPDLSHAWANHCAEEQVQAELQPVHVKPNLLSRLGSLLGIGDAANKGSSDTEKKSCTSGFCTPCGSGGCECSILRAVEALSSATQPLESINNAEAEGDQEQDSPKALSDQYVELTDAALMSIRNVTRFSARRIQDWHRAFHVDCPSGAMSEADLVSLFGHFHPDGSARRWAQHLFRSFGAAEQSGEVDFNRFIYMLSLVRRGTVAQRVCWAFDLYDVGRRGYVTLRGMSDVLESIQAMAGYALGGDEPADLARKFLRAASAGGDEVVDLRQFLAAVLQDDFMIMVTLDLV